MTPESTMATRIDTPWGWWEILDEGPEWKVKRLHVKPNHRTSLQYHRFRHESWLVIDGEGMAVAGKLLIPLVPGKRVALQPRKKHRISGSEPDGVTIIETQYGICKEEDIKRLDDDYGRG